MSPVSSKPLPPDAAGPLKIIHLFRSPVGGIFRHVRDLIDQQVADGHQVGIICDNNTGGEFEEKMFDKLSPQLALGLHRMFMHRSISPLDIAAGINVSRTVRSLAPDILHAHGSKGGAYARLAGVGRRGFATLYCPHGGSMHYSPTSLKGRVFFALERFLERWTDRLIFVSDYDRKNYAANVGAPECPYSLVFNGLQPHEFEPIELAGDAADFLYIGMMRDLKGVDLFIDALLGLAKTSDRRLNAHLVGDGPDLDQYKQRIDAAGGELNATFHAPMPAREAFKLARNVVVPSRAESMPYIVLETLAAQCALIATRVGGIPEIYADRAKNLVEPDNSEALQTAMAHVLENPISKRDRATFAQEIESRFSVAVMGHSVMDAYRRSLLAR